MNLQCREDLACTYKAKSQVARILSEDWCRRELYCAACNSDRLESTKANTPAVDFQCPKCNQPYQLKSSRLRIARKIVDAGYNSMIRAIRSDNVPNLLVLRYSSTWTVTSLLLVPSFFFAESAIEQRKPLGPNAKRAGWIGCNILLDRIPPDGLIQVVSEGTINSVQAVREDFARLRGLSEIPPGIRGWTLEVLKAIRKLKKKEFGLSEAYAFQTEFESSHPGNRNVRPKIRQQLQVLRDFGIITFLGRGRYRVN